MEQSSGEKLDEDEAANASPANPDDPGTAEPESEDPAEPLDENPSPNGDDSVPDEGPPVAVNDVDSTLEDVQDENTEVPEELPEDGGEPEESPQEEIPTEEAPEAGDEPPEEVEEPPEKGAESIAGEEPQAEDEVSAGSWLFNQDQELDVQHENREQEADEPIGAMEGVSNADDVIDFLEEQVITDENELEASDSVRLQVLAEGIVAAILTSSVLSARQPDVMQADDDMVELPTSSLSEPSQQEPSLPGSSSQKMVDKAVQANAKEIDEALEGAENLGPAVDQALLAGVMSEGDVYQSCEEADEIPMEQILVSPVMAPEVEGEEDLNAEDQWEDLPEDEEESVPAEGAEPPSELESEPEEQPNEPDDISVPNETADASVPSEPEEAYAPSAPPEETVPPEEETAPSAQETTSLPEETPPAKPSEPPKETTAAQPSEPPPNIVKRSESAEPIKSSEPAEKPPARATASESSKPSPPPPAAKPAVTPRSKPTPSESEEASEWQFSRMLDDFVNSPYSYIGKFVAMCIVIRALRNIIQASPCS